MGSCGCEACREWESAAMFEDPYHDYVVEEVAVLAGGEC